MVVLDSVWFSNRDGLTGIVRVQDEWEGIKYYIGRAHGMSVEDDTQHIADWGSTFPIEAGNALFHIKE